MTSYRYILEKNSKKHPCPDCGKKRFVRFIDIETKEYLPEQYGKCDRLINCGYDCNPYKDGYNKSQMANNGNNRQSKNAYKTPIKPIENQVETQKANTPIPENILLHTLKDYDNNSFIQYLCTNFGTDAVVKQLETYYVGTVKDYTSFPFIDSTGVCRAISLIQYDANCKRNKNEIQARNIHTFLQAEFKKRTQAPPDWLTKYLQNESFYTCMFGEHLINQAENKYKPIAVVEAPKTAFIASIVYPMYVWFAPGALAYLTDARIKAIQNREVYLFPDTSTDGTAFNLWNKKAKQYNFTCIDLLEQMATDTEKKVGYDLADYILECKDVFNITTDEPTIKLETIGINGNNEAELFTEPCRTTAEATKINTNTDKTFTSAYIDSNGILYIPTPPLNKTYTRYANGITAYNNRSEVPDFVADIPPQTNEVFINLKTLTI